MSSRRVLGWALAATLALTGWAALQDEEATASTRADVAPGVDVRPLAIRASRAAAPPRPVWPAAPTVAARGAFAPLAADAAQAWGGPAPAGVAGAVQAVRSAAAEQPSPAAPAFPYTLIGRLDDGAAPMALLSGPQRSFAAKAGELIDGAWRVEDVKPSGLILTWIPGGIRQTLSYRPS